MDNLFKKKYGSVRKGVTLVEMMIAIAIFTMGIEGFSLLLVRTWKQNAYTIEMGQTAMAVSQGVNKMVGYIREVRQGDNGAYPVELANDNELTVYCDFDRDGATERLHFYLDSGNLVMGIRRPSGAFPVTYASGDEEVQIIAYRIVNEPGNPLFAYYDANYPEDSTSNPVSTPAAVPNVRLVRITIHMNIDPNRAPDNVQIQSFAEMRNLNDHDRYGI